MLKWEIRKLCTRFTAVSVLVLLALNAAVVLILYAEQGGERGRLIREAKAEIYDEYKNDPAAYEAGLAEYREEQARYTDWLRNGEGRFVPVNRKIDLEGYGDRQLYAEVLAGIERAENYRSDLDRVLKDAYARLKNLSERRGTYAYEYQVNVILRYEALGDLAFEPEDVRGWNEYFSLVTPAIFCTLAVVVLGAQAFLNEKQARITGILHVCRRGEIRTRLAKAAALFLLSAALTAAFSLLPLAVFGATTGLSSPAEAVQALEAYEFCPVRMTIGQMLLSVLALRIAVFFALALLTASLGALSGSYVLTFGTLFLFLGANAMAKTGFFTVAFATSFFERYRAVDLSGVLVSALPFCLSIVLAAAVLGFLGVMVLKINTRDLRLPGVLRRLSARFCALFNREERGRGGGWDRTLFRWELGKTVLNPRALVMIVLLAVMRLLLTDPYFTPSYSGNEAAYRAYLCDLAALGGQLGEETDAYIGEEAAYIARSLAEYEASLPLYREGKISYDEFSVIRDRRGYAESAGAGFAKLLERQAYLRGTAGRYENLGYLDDAGVCKLAGGNFDVVFAAAVLLLFSDLFAGERQSGFAAIERLTKYGRGKTWRAKTGAALLTAAVLWLAFCAADLFLVFSRFPMDGLGFGVKSVPELAAGEGNPPIWVHLVLTKAAGLAGALLLTLFASGISALSDRTLTVLSVLFVFFLGPYLTSVFGMTLLDRVSAEHVLNPSLPADLGKTAGWLLTAGILAVLGAIRWIGGTGRARRRPQTPPTVSRTNTTSTGEDVTMTLS